MAHDGRYRTTSGREVLLEQVHIERFDLGYDGQGEFIRARVLERLPDRARRLFPSNNGLLIREAAKGEHGAYPRFIVLVEFHSFEPVGSQADCSGLIVVWFVESMPTNLHELIATELGRVVWEDHAVDGY